jgi:hypothetical protein
MSDVEPRPAVRTTCVKMLAPRKVCGRADAATRYATLWAWDVQRCAQCSDLPVQEGLDKLARRDARSQVDTMLRDGCTAGVPGMRARATVCAQMCCAVHDTCPLPHEHTRAECMHSGRVHDSRM